MSQWTHVNGSLRLDGMPGLVMKDGDDFEKLWEAEMKRVFDDNIPAGTEGGIEHSIEYYDKESSIMLGQVFFWADLRDYSNVDEIELYFKGICERIAESKMCLMIRDLVVSIDVEYQDQFILVYDKKELKRIVHERKN